MIEILLIPDFENEVILAEVVASMGKLTQQEIWSGTRKKAEPINLDAKRLLSILMKGKAALINVESFTIAERLIKGL